MAILYIMVGIPGSGKSTYAASLNADVHSSDAIREELYGDASVQEGGDKVFKLLEKRVFRSLRAGKDTVYDATNITPRTRQRIIHKFKNSASSIKAVYIARDLNTALKQNKSRKRFVPEDVIHKMNSRLIIPTVNEGFDEVIIVQ